MEGSAAAQVRNGLLQTTTEITLRRNLAQAAQAQPVEHRRKRVQVVIHPNEPGQLLLELAYVDTDEFLIAL